MLVDDETGVSVPYQFIFRLEYITKAKIINKPILPTSNAVSSKPIKTKMKLYKAASKISSSKLVFMFLKWPCAYNTISNTVARADNAYAQLNVMYSLSDSSSA